MHARDRLFGPRFLSIALACLIGASAICTGACGPVQYVNQVTRKASTSVDAARAAGAEEYAPYHYTLAVEYLHKAREEAAAADFQAAHRFGLEAHQAAEKARELARSRAADPDDASWRPPPELAEALQSGASSDTATSDDDTATDNTTEPEEEP